MKIDNKKHKNTKFKRNQKNCLLKENLGFKTKMLLKFVK